MIIEYARIMRQILLMEQESGFVSVATTVGLAERAMEPRIDRCGKFSDVYYSYVNVIFFSKKNSIAYTPCYFFQLPSSL